MFGKLTHKQTKNQHSLIDNEMNHFMVLTAAIFNPCWWIAA